MPTPRPETLQALVDLGFLSATQVDAAIAESESSATNPLQYLTSSGLVTPKQVVQANCHAAGVTFLELTDVTLDPAATTLLSGDYAKRESVLPVGFVNNRLQVAVTHRRAGDLPLRDDLQRATKYAVDFVVAMKDDIAAKINKTYRAEGELTELSSNLADEEETNLDDLGAITSETDDAPIVRFVNLIITQAISDGASDIHIEPTETELRVRYRIDGVLKESTRLAKNVVNSVISRIKIMSDMNIAERRVPQDGRLSVVHNGKKIDLRVASLPTVYGAEKVVMRILDNSTASLSLDDLGFSPWNYERFKSSYVKPYGMILVTGPTGSGKALGLSTPVPTPTGTTTMGALQVGDMVLGRDGKPCRVTGLSEIEDNPNLYRVRFSDGQSVIADGDHQWLVGDHHGRSLPRTRNRREAIERHEAAHRDADDIDVLSGRWGGQRMSTAAELHSLLAQFEVAGEFPSSYAVTSALDVTDCPRATSNRSHVISDTTTRPQKATVYPTAPILAAIAASRSKYADKAAELYVDPETPPRAQCLEIGAWFGVGNWLASETVKRLSLEGEEVIYEVKYDREFKNNPQVLEYPTDVALKCLAIRLRERFSHAPSSEATLHRLTTEEMIARGLNLSTGHADFAVPVAGALNLPDAVVPVDPYVFGAWLGDGVADRGVIVSDPTDVVGGAADMDAMRACLASAGYQTTVSSGNAYHLHVENLREGLREAGVLGQKHIPVTYLRASAEQRLALLQGLLDTDGTIDANGSCELSLSDKRLASDALDLIRSLGIKASVSWDQPAAYRDSDGLLVECKDRHRIHFTTRERVFRLARKAERLPEQTRETQNWVYITGIEKIDHTDPEYGPARCISVDSEDHTYLCGDGYLVTSNSTTLYATVNIVSEPTVNVITVEDPVEYRIEGINQVQVNNKANMTFAAALKSILRCDPDIVLIGEIRDGETAHIAVEAALTGHLVLSTLHTNDAPSAIVRLTEMGVEPFLVGSAVDSVLAQRLCRRLCSNCKVEYQTTEEELAGLHQFPWQPGEELPVLFKASESGCNTCSGMGYKGRMALHEVMLMSEEIERLAVERASSEEIMKIACLQGMKTLRQDGWYKVSQGMTSIQEVLRVVV